MATDVNTIFHLVSRLDATSSQASRHFPYFSEYPCYTEFESKLSSLWNSGCPSWSIEVTNGQISSDPHRLTTSLTMDILISIQGQLAQPENKILDAPYSILLDEWEGISTS